MISVNWRREVKNILYGFYASVKYLKSLENDLIFSQSPYRGGGFRGGVSDPTAVKTMLLEKGEIAALKQEISAVKQLLQELGNDRRDSKYKKQLLEMVYFKRSHSLYGAAAWLEIPERTAHRWNAKMLRRLAEILGYFIEE